MGALATYPAALSMEVVASAPSYVLNVEKVGGLTISERSKGRPALLDAVNYTRAAQFLAHPSGSNLPKRHLVLAIFWQSQALVAGSIDHCNTIGVRIRVFPVSERPHAFGEIEMRVTSGMKDDPTKFS